MELTCSDQETKNQRSPDPRSERYVSETAHFAFSWPANGIGRLTVDLTELSLPSTMKTYFPNPDDLLNFTLTIEPDEGNNRSFLP